MASRSECNYDYSTIIAQKGWELRRVVKNRREEQGSTMQSLLSLYCKQDKRRTQPFSAHPIMHCFPNKWTCAPMPLLGYLMSEEQWSEGKDNQYERNWWSPHTAIINRKTNRLTTVAPRSPIVRQGPTWRVLGVLNADALRLHARHQRVIAQYFPDIIQFWRHNGWL